MTDPFDVEIPPLLIERAHDILHRTVAATEEIYTVARDVRELGHAIFCLRPEGPSPALDDALVDKWTAATGWDDISTALAAAAGYVIEAMGGTPVGDPPPFYEIRDLAACHSANR